MPRHARLRLAAYPLHVVQRGNNRSACFRSDSDYLVYLNLLRDGSHRFICAIHALVLMTNHVHLLLTPDTADASSLMMKHVGQCYAQYFNRKYERTGTLWEGRFKSSIVQEQRYLLACYRYIELNPVRAGIVQHPGEYRWSSYRCNAEAAPSTLITPHAGYLALADGEHRFQAYRALFDIPLDNADLDEIRSAVKGGFAIGDDGFKGRLAAGLGRPVAPREPGRPAARRPTLKSGSVPDLNRGLSLI